MVTRIVGLLMALGIMGLAVFSLVTVKKIVAIGGPQYTWEYIPPIMLALFGAALFVYWLWRIITTISTHDVG